MTVYKIAIEMQYVFSTEKVGGMHVAAQQASKETVTHAQGFAYLKFNLQVRSYLIFRFSTKTFFPQRIA